MIALKCLNERPQFSGISSNTFVPLNLLRNVTGLNAERQNIKGCYFHFTTKKKKTAFRLKKTQSCKFFPIINSSDGFVMKLSEICSILNASKLYERKWVVLRCRWVNAIFANLSSKILNSRIFDGIIALSSSKLFNTEWFRIHNNLSWNSAIVPRVGVPVSVDHFEQFVDIIGKFLTVERVERFCEQIIIPEA